MVWVRTERATLVPEHNRQRITGLLVAVDATAYVLGALAVRYAGFEPVALGAIASLATVLYVLLHLEPGVAPAARADVPALPSLDEKLARLRAWLADNRDVVETRLAEAIPRLGLVKRANPPPAWGTPLAASPVDAVLPIGVGLTPMVLPRALRDAGVRTSSLAASTEEIAAFARPLDDVRADALPRAGIRAFSRNFSRRRRRSSRAGCRRDSTGCAWTRCCGRASPSAMRIRPCSPRVLRRSKSITAARRATGSARRSTTRCSRRTASRASASSTVPTLIDDVYEAFVDWLVDRTTPKRFSNAFSEGQVPLRSCRATTPDAVNDIEGPRIAAHVSRRYGVEADYFVGFCALASGRPRACATARCPLVGAASATSTRSPWERPHVTD
jgi:hypothetical protein